MKRIILTECFEENQFEQLCINYTNEKIQNFCTQRLIRDEQEFYKLEGLEAPTISFPGNDIVLGELSFIIFLSYSMNFPSN